MARTLLLTTFLVLCIPALLAPWLPAACAQSQSTREPDDSSASTAQANVPITRVRGIIDRETTWSGHVMIIDDVTIIGTTVRVAPGTLIEFANADRSPLLSIGSRKGDRGELILNSADGKRITFTSREGTQPGRIEFHLWDNSEEYDPKKPRTTLEIGRATFRNLGDTGEPTPRDSKATSRPAVESEVASPNANRFGSGHPAISIMDHGIGSIIRISNCTFERAAAIHVSGGSAADFRFENNSIRSPIGPAGVVIRTAPAEKWESRATISSNRLECPIDLQCPWFDLSDNVLVGQRAAIVIRPGASRICKIRNNYIHNTAAMLGGYCLDMQSPEVVVTENILIGGADTVYRGSRFMSGNFIVSADPIDGDLIGVTAERGSPQNVRSLARGARFERNTLIGFGAVSLNSKPDSQYSGDSKWDDTMLLDNLFVGTGEGQFAIHTPLFYGGCGNASPPGLVVEKNRFIGLQRYNHAGRGLPAGVREGKNSGGERPTHDDPLVRIEAGRKKGRDLIASLLSHDRSARIREWDSALFEEDITPKDLLKKLNEQLARDQATTVP